MIDNKSRRLLAASAVEAIFDPDPTYHSQGELTRKELLERSGIGTGEIDPRLSRLVDEGLMRKRNTGYNGYGDHWVEGSDVWAVTRAGLTFLLMGL